MNRTIACALLASASALCYAQDAGTTKLQCEGTYTNFAYPDMRDVPIKGIYVEVSGDRVKVLGTTAFDASYSVITRREDGLGFRHESNPLYNGFLSRFSGELTVMEKGAIVKDGVMSQLKQILNAVCRKAKPLF